MNASILIVTYNSAVYLQHCLASVMREIWPEDEIILVDNASTDGSAQIIRRGWPKVALVRNSENLGFAAAGNQAARLAHKEMLVFLNPDTVVLPGWLDGLRQVLASDQTAALVTSQVLTMSQAGEIKAGGEGRCGQAPCGQVPCAQGVHFSGLVFGRSLVHDGGKESGHAGVGAASGASFAVRRRVWEELGGFDETYWMYYEDTDLSWRAWHRGYRCLAAPESAILHDQPSAPSGQTLFYMARNRYLLLCKNFHPGTLLLLAPGIILAEAVDWGRAWLDGKRALMAKLRAGWWLLAHLPVLVRNKGAMQNDLKILEACTYRLEPRLMPAGWIGSGLLKACNAVFRMNYRLALHILRRLGR
ncbi:MAG: glycosyltransferase family 2 protein [Anaerolineales bacterium]